MILPGILGLAAAVATTAPEPSPPAPAASAVSAPSPSLVFHPAGPGVGRVAVALGMSLDLQRYATDQGFIPVLPLATLALRFGLPHGFFAAAELHTLFIINEATVGAGWAASLPALPRLSFMVRFMGGTQVGWFVGSGFQTVTISPILKPSVAIGWAADHGLRWTLREQLLLASWQFVNNGGYWTDNRSRGADVFSGAETQLTLENLLDRGGNIHFGLAGVLARPSVTLWLPFAPQQALNFFPRLFAGYAF